MPGILGLVALAVVAFVYAAVRFRASNQAPQLAVALGLAFLALAIAVTAGLTPPTLGTDSVEGGDRQNAFVVELR